MTVSRRQLSTLAPTIALALLLGVAATVHAGPTVVFFTDFNAGAPVEMSGETLTVPVSGYAGLGNGGNVFGGDLLRNVSAGNPGVATRLTLAGLPPHNSVDLNFLLATIDSWDGTVGPDVLTVLVNGAPLFSENFMNSDMGLQTYAPPAMVLLAYDTPLGFSGGAGQNDAAYDMGLDPVFDAIPHTSSSLVIDFFGQGAGYGAGGLGDETFGLDNLEVIVNAICDPTPAVGCLGGQSASFQVKTKGGPSKYQIKWKLAKGDAFAQGDLGMPEATARYTLCVYDETAATPTLAAELTVEPNAFWQSKAPKGYNYKDKTGTEGGVQKAQLKTGDLGKTKVQVKAKGPNTAVPIPFSGAEMFDQDGAVTVQLINSDTATCWTTAFTTAKKNELEQFKAKAP